MEALVRYNWQGNIRELENTIERAVVVAETDELTHKNIPPGLLTSSDTNKEDLSLKKIEKEHILKVLQITGGSKKKAALLLELDTATLWRRLNKYRISG